MGAKISADTIFALELVRKGKKPKEAAAEAGVFASTVYRAIKRRNAEIERQKDEIKKRVKG